MDITCISPHHPWAAPAARFSEVPGIQYLAVRAPEQVLAICERMQVPCSWELGRGGLGGFPGWCRHIEKIGHKWMNIWIWIVEGKRSPANMDLACTKLRFQFEKKW